MKVVICGAIDGNADIINKIHSDVGCGAVLTTGNIGLYYRLDKQRKPEESFYKYLSGQKHFECPLIGVVGSKENYKIANLIWEEKLHIHNFKLLQNGEKFTFKQGSDGFGVTGMGGGYSGKYFNMSTQEKDSKLSGQRYFNHEDAARLNSNYETNILLTHELIGPLTGKNITFIPEQLAIFYQTFAVYCFVGRYRKFFHSTFPRSFRGLELVSLPSVNDGYAILDTKDWSLAVVGNIVKEKS